MGVQFGSLVADDTRYQEALRRRSEILDQVKQLQEELRLVDEFTRIYERLFSHGVAERGSAAPHNPPTANQVKRPRNPLPPARLAEVCRDILLERGRPMNRSELLEAVEARGIPLVGGDPAKNLGTILWRFKDLFVSVKGQGYWLANRPLARQRTRTPPSE